MLVHIKVENMKEAEHLSDICKQYPNELALRGDRFCVDPKSTLGILAMMYSARDKMFLDTGDIEDDVLPDFLAAVDSYLVRDPEEE